MAKKSMIARENKRAKLINKYWQRRQELKEIIKNPESDIEQVIDAQEKLAKLPVNSNPVRRTARCNLCGRPHAVYRKFQLCRICLRKQLMTGNVPGGKKSSW